MTLFTLTHSVVYFMFDRCLLCLCVCCERMLILLSKMSLVVCRLSLIGWCRNLRQNPHYYIPARVYILLLIYLYIINNIYTLTPMQANSDKRQTTKWRWLLTMTIYYDH